MPTKGLVLLADDDPIARRVYTQILATAGYEVESACDGTEALARVALVRPALVVLDLEMPGLDGLQVARALRADPALRAIRIVALTGKATAENRTAAHEIGFHAFLAKPCARAEFLAEVERQLAAIS